MSDKIRGMALFVGIPYVDIVMKVDKIPTGDEKTLAQQSSVSFGGNATTAAFCCAQLGIDTDLIGARGNDPFGHMIDDWVSQYNINWHPRLTRSTSYSAIFPNAGMRAMVRHRDENYLRDFPKPDMDACRLVHVDGLQNDAALYHLREARRRKLTTSLDGGSLRPNMEEIFSLTDIAVVSLRLCDQMSMSPRGMLAHLRYHKCKVGVVTLGEEGMLWYEGAHSDRHMPALPVPKELVVDTNGAGDIFHGAYIYSFLRWTQCTWETHFKFARAAAAHAVQHLGNEDSLPSLDDVRRAEREFGSIKVVASR